MDTNAQVTSGPASFDELVVEIRSRMDSLSTSHKKLAQRVLSDPEAVAFMTVSELAGAVGVNEATVVRFANGLGLKGYPGLTRLCRERLQEQAQLLRRFDNLEHLVADGAGLLEQTVGLDQANIARTFARIDDVMWESVVDRLARAPRVHVMGLRKCHAPAYLLSYLLGMLREDVATINASAGSLTDELRRVHAGDCFVAISIHRYSLDTVRAAQWARQRGAHVIALTDTAVSPLAMSAHDTFYIEASSASVLRSMTAFTSLVQAMTGAVAHLLGHQVRPTLLDEERLLAEFGTYADTPSE
ncbi:MurR/RpiR family transcriptional regulator [Nocardia sp. GCM10030253]|uniref:MurR/RpiR family transcriptional regulator n=1 Tax=Nocardia sp. GCM10030253 TaxID=3273404 RepID=UPI0036341C67